jgi:hypothetical protein
MLSRDIIGKIDKKQISPDHDGAVCVQKVPTLTVFHFFWSLEYETDKMQLITGTILLSAALSHAFSSIRDV